jgi:nucleotide-binding universal stress UspA family protein
MSTATESRDRHPEPVGHPLRVLIADDGSQSAAAATVLGLRIAGRTHGEALLLHAEAHHAEHGRWQRHLDTVAEYAPAHAATRTVITHGAPADEILRIATTEGADVICVGASALSGRLGSVSSRVVHRARCPVLVSPQAVSTSPAHIAAVVLGLDGSDNALDALPSAERLAEIFDATLVLFTRYVVLAPSAPERRQGFKQRALGILTEAHERLTTRAAVVDDIADGLPREALLDAARRHAPALLVVGRHGLGGVKERLLGSTTSAMLARARCPVLVVPPRPE